MTLAKAGLTFLAMVLASGLAPAEEKKDSPAVTALKSLKLSGYVHVYGIAWDEGTDTFSLRRARAALAGELAKNIRFKLSIDAVRSPILLDAEIDFVPSGIAGLKIGQFRVPFSLESFTSTSDLDMINRSSVVDTLAAGRDIGSPGRDIGLVVFGSWRIAEYSLGFVNGAGINKSDPDGHKDFVGRLVLKPAKFIAFGGSLYRGKRAPAEGEPLAARNKEGLDAVISLDPVTIKGEYIHARDALVSKAGWYAQAGVFALPRRLQALVRYDSLDLDRAVPDDGTRIISFGLNWFIAGKTKLQVNYEIHGLEAGGREKSGLLAQFQAAF